MWVTISILFLAILVKQLIKAPPKSARNLIAVAIDMLIATIIWKTSNITISSHSAIAALNGKKWGLYMCKFLNWIEPNHCANAITSDIEKAQEAINILTKKID